MLKIILLLRNLQNQLLGTGHLDFARHIDPAFGDDILRNEDVTPNSKGAELAGVAPSKNGFRF